AVGAGDERRRAVRPHRPQALPREAAGQEPVGSVSRRVWAAACAAALVVAGCGSGDGLDGPAGPLTGVCPDPLVIQADWYPLVEQGPLYALLDRDHQVVTAEDGIVQARLEFDGVDQGIVLEIRSGGAAIAHTDVPRLLHEEPELFGGLD